MLLEFTPRWKARLGRPREAIYLHLLSTSISLLFPHFVSSFSSLLTFFFCFSHLFTPGRRKARKRLLDFNCPTHSMLQAAEESAFFWDSAVFVFHHLQQQQHCPSRIYFPCSCPGKLCLCQSQPEWCLATLGWCHCNYRWWGRRRYLSLQRSWVKS